MKKILLILTFFCFSLSAGLPVKEEYHSPTEQLIKRESWRSIEKKLKKMHIPLELVPYFETIASYENWGHIGYHGANQGFRIYQDIIRITLEEIVEISIRDDFHFLRVPGDPDLHLNTLEEFTEYWGKKKIDNKSDLRAKQLLSMNYSIYSNFDSSGSCSLNLFVKDKSKNKVNFIKGLTPLYEELGISPKALHELFAIGEKWLNGQGGILLQIAETSHLNDEEAYNFADLQCYPAKRGGYRYGEYPISNHFDRIMTDLYLKHKLDISPQLRMLINNRHTLNPFSCLSIRRLDLYDPTTIEQYEAEMRAFIHTLHADKNNVKFYREYILELWSEASY